jgi:hypothetical protein
MAGAADAGHGATATSSEDAKACTSTPPEAAPAEKKTSADVKVEQNGVPRTFGEDELLMKACDKYSRTPDWL